MTEHYPLALSAPNFFGIGEFLTGMALGAIALVLVVFVAIAVSEWFDTRRAASETFPEPHKASRGTIVCDYIETESLKTIARQRGVPLDPDRLEMASASDIEGSVGGGSSALGARVRRRKGSEQREFYDDAIDYHLLLRQVLKDLEEAYELNTQLGAVPLVDFMDDSFMDRLNEAARESEREAVASIRDRMLTEEKAKEFRAAADDSRFVLIESDWRVRETESGELTLSLVRLHRHDDYEYMMGPGRQGHAPPKAARMPSGISLEVPLLASAKLTPQGESRLRDDSAVQAGVFGTVTAFDSAARALTLTPTAVFARIGT